MKNQGGDRVKWVAVGVSFMTLALGYGSTYYSFSLFFTAFLGEFHWSRSLAAGVFSVFLLLLGASSPFIGSLIDRFGPRRIFLPGSLILGAGLGLCSLIHSWWELYLYFGLVTAVGSASIGFVPNATMIQQRFSGKRGYAMGILSAGIGFGMFVCVPLIQHLIDHVGWRMTFRVLAIVLPLIITIMVGGLIKNIPRKDRSRGEEREETPGERDRLRVLNKEWVSRRWTIREAATTRQFWLFELSLFLTNFMIHSVLTHQIAFFVDQGESALYASYIAGLIGMVSIAGKIMWGGVSDQIGREATHFAGTACSIIGIGLLILFTIYPAAVLPYLYALFFGLGYAAITAVSPLIAADFFEGETYGRILGALFMSISIGGACGVGLTGLLYDLAKSYVSAFALLMACTLCASISIWIAAPRKIRGVSGLRPRRQG